MWSVICTNLLVHLSITLHWNIWQFEQPQPGAASTVAVKVAGLAAKWWNLQTETSHLPPSMPPQKMADSEQSTNKTPKHKKQTLRGKPHGANMGIFKKNMFCSQCIGKNRDPYFSSISAMLIRVTKILKCLHNKGIKMSSGSGDLCPTPDMHKRWSWTVHRPQKIRGRTSCSQGAFIFCSLISSNDLNLHGTFFSQMTSTHQVMTFQADFADIFLRPFLYNLCRT